MVVGLDLVETSLAEMLMVIEIILLSVLLKLSRQKTFLREKRLSEERVHVEHHLEAKFN